MPKPIAPLIPNQDWFYPAQVGRLLCPPIDRRTVLKLCDGLRLPYKRMLLSHYAKIPRSTVMLLLHPPGCSNQPK